MKGALVVVTLVLLVLAGCAQTMFVKPGGTAESFEADKFECEAKVQTMYGGQANMNFGHLATYREDLFRCIRSKGWREATRAEIEEQRGNGIPEK